MRHLLYLVGMLTCTAVAARPDCEGYSDPQKYYFGKNGTIISAPETVIYRNPFNAEQLAYLTRIHTAFKRLGTEVILLPIPAKAFSFAGKLDIGEIKGTPFEQMNTAAYIKNSLANYQLNVQEWSAAGFPAVDIMKTLIDAQVSKRIAKPYLKQDDHWTPEAAKLVSHQANALVRIKFPTLAPLLDQVRYTVTTSPRTVNFHGWRGAVQAKCPTWKPLDEQYSSIQIEAEAQGLLDDDLPPAVLLGSSYSVDDRRYGLSERLALALGLQIENHSLSGGATFGAMLNYYSTRDVRLPNPKLLIWEFPVASADFSVTDMRQILPLLTDTSTQPAKFNMNLARPTINIVTPGIAGPSHFIKITPTSYRTRSLVVELETATSKEVVELRRSYGEVPKSWFLELRDAVPLKRITLKLTEPVTGSAEIEIRKY